MAEAVDIILSIVERIGFPALVGLLLFALLYQLVKAYQEDRRQLARDRDAQSTVTSQLLSLNSQNTAQINLLRTTLEQISSSERLALEANLKAIQDNTAAIQSNTAQISEMSASLISSISQHLTTITTDHRAMQAQMAEYAVQASRERAVLLDNGTQMLQGIGALDASMQAQARGIELLTSAVHAGHKESAAGRAQQKAELVDEFKMLSEKLARLPEDIAAQLRPTLEPLVSQVQRLVERFEALAAAQLAPAVEKKA